MTLPGQVSVGPSGAANYSIPIVTPPGTAGVVPQLSLSYSSQGGNGLLGMGWSLAGLPSITRCSKTVSQDGVTGSIKYDANDRFCLDGDRLVAISGAYGADGTEYRTEIESYNKIISRGTAGYGPAWFEVRTKSGQVMEFGHTTDSLILAQGKSTARAWTLNKLSDTKGNYLNVTYTNDTTNGQFLPSEIHYTGNANAGLSPFSRVQFIYDPRPDIHPGYQAGSLSRLTARLANVRTLVGASLVTDYRLAYSQSIATGRSLLASVTACDSAGACLPATTFSWQGGVAGDYSFVNIGAGVSLYTVSGTLMPLVGDFNGDGKTDILRVATNQAENVLLLSRGDGDFLVPPSSMLSTVDLTHSDGSLISLTGDFNGDGKTDILRVGDNPAVNALLISQGDGSFSTSSLAGVQLYHSNGSFRSVLGDFNGDGKTDILRIGTNQALNVVLLSAGNGNFSDPAWGNLGGVQLARSDGSMICLTGDFNGDGKTDILRVSDNPAENALMIWREDGGLDGFSLAGNTLNHSNGSIRPLLADFNGDGKTDILRVSINPAENALYLSNGAGSVTAPSPFNLGGASLVQGTSSQPYDGVARGRTTRRIDNFLSQVGDFDGDGKADIFRWWDNPASNALLLSNGDGSFRTSQAPFGGVSFSSSNGALVSLIADFDGNGKSDIFRVADNPTGNAFFPMNTGRFDVVSGVTSGLGASTQISYKPLTDNSVYTKDTGAAYPMINYQGSLYVVSEVAMPNGIGGTYRTAYNYVGMNMDAEGRGSLGFRQVKTTDLQTNIITTTTYRQDFPYIGQASIATRTLSSLTLNQATNTFQFSNTGGAASLSSPSVTSAPYRVSVSQTVTQSADLDGTAMPTMTTTYQYDAFGNPTQVASSTSDGFSKTTTNTYTNDTSLWLLGQLTRATMTSVAP